MRQAGQIGLGRTAQFRLLARLGVSEIRIPVDGLAAPVFCRVNDSDIWEFRQSLGSGEEPLKLPFVPKVIVDAGANVGYASLRFQRRFPNAKIVALEPELGNVVQFRKNCAAYPNIAVEAKALWPRPARLRIEGGGASNAFRVFEDAAGGIPATSIGELMVTHGLAHIDLLKIDIEGSEIELFDDPVCEEWLGNVRAIVIETHDGMRAGSSAAVKRRLQQRFTFEGLSNEYEVYLLKS